MNTISGCNAHFYLTGGTALSRVYYNHRYSDDLDFFVNNDASYLEQVKLVLAKLQEAGFSINTEQDFIQSADFNSCKVRWEKSDAILKLDFVNNYDPYFGELQSSALFDRVDCLRNILSNKLSALVRLANKDVADIREIALHESFDWAQIICEARQKVIGIEASYMGELLKGMPKHEFDNILWTHKPTWETFRADIDRIVFDMMNCVNRQN
jgi:hypothetical protein